MELVLKATQQKNKLLSAVYGEERIDDRMNALGFLGDLRDTYEHLFTPARIMHVWDEMEYDHNIIVDESIRRMQQALHRAARREISKEKSLLPIKEGTSARKSPTAFQMGRSLGFWKSRVFPS